MVTIESRRQGVQARVHHVNGQSSGIDVSALARYDPSRRLLDCLVQIANTQKPYSQIRIFRAANFVLGESMATWEAAGLPNDAATWQCLVTKLYEHHFTRTDTKQKLRSTVNIWNTFAICLERLRDHCRYLPLDVVVPRAPSRFEKGETLPLNHTVIGQRTPPQPVQHVDKLLLPLDLARSDAAYLEVVRDELLYRRKLLEQCLLAWWEQIKAHYTYGQALLGSVDWPALRHSLTVPRDGESVKRRTNGATTETLANQLAVIAYEHDGLNATKVVKASPFMYRYIGYLCLPVDTPAAFDGVQRSQRVDWMLGNLSNLDYAVLTALLILRNPNFTPFAVLDARIADRNGQCYLELGEQGFRFRVDKPRARAMKEAVLDEISTEIVQTLYKINAPARQRLLTIHSPAANYLLLVRSADGSFATPLPGVVEDKLRNAVSPLYRAFPALREALPPGTITLSKIRATQGVLEWFRTGSIVAMRKRLGNSTVVVLQHYLPPSLLAAWNTRLIRRFQNLWITVAASADDFLLDVTDFQSRAELDAFVADMLRLHAKGSSPLADELHSRFDNDPLSRRSGQVGRRADQLAISVSKNALLALYLYQEAAMAKGLSAAMMDRRDAAGLCPRQFINLAELLRHEIPSHSDGTLRHAHAQALAALVNHPAKAKWGELIAHREKANGH